MTNELSTEGRRRKKRGRRDWVKNAIIIFLAVLLVLTFFSNTIMNYSLPEVAAQYPQVYHPDHENPWFRHCGICPEL